MNNYQKKIQKHRKLRYGGFAVTLTVVVVALTVIINAIFSALSQKYLWFIDMTGEKQYGITDKSTDLLNGYEKDDELEIDIIFCMPEDQLDGTYLYSLVHKLALQYEKEFDYVKVSYRDIITHPDSVKKYYSTSVSAPKTTSVIVANGDKSRIMDMKAFYVTDTDSGEVFAFNGEYKFTSSILQLVGDNPIAYFSTNHSEDVQNSVIKTLFEDAGYEVRTIDLSAEELDEDAKVLVINNPKYDFMGAGDSVNEIKKVDGLLDRLGSVMVFVDAEARDLSELEELLSEWGIEFADSLIYDYSNSLSVDGTELVAEYVTEGTGASITSTLRELENVPKTIVNYARPINILFDSYNSRNVSAVLRTSGKGTAKAVDFGSAEAEGVNGVYNLMTLSCEQRYIDNEPHYAYVLAAGTDSFADDKYVGRGSYGNRDIIFTIMKAFGKETVPLDIDFKLFDEKELDITTAQANKWSVVLTVCIPCVVFIAAALESFRRKHL